MGAWMMALYSVVSYVLFLVTFTYSALFVAGLPFVKGIDAGALRPAQHAIAVDLLLLALFAVQHSVMARRGFKRWWTRLVPQPIERSTYVLAATAALAILLWQWQPIPQPVVWSVSSPLGTALVWTVSALGWVVALSSTFLIDHFELFGLRQPFTLATGKMAGTPEFRTPLLYRMVRHPLYLGLLIAFWATPRMSAGHLLFSVGTTAYIFLGIFFEERDLVAQFGARYHDYRERVAMILPFTGSRR